MVPGALRLRADVETVEQNQIVESIAEEIGDDHSVGVVVHLGKSVGGVDETFGRIQHKCVRLTPRRIVITVVGKEDVSSPIAIDIDHDKFPRVLHRRCHAQKLAVDHEPTGVRVE